MESEEVCWTSFQIVVLVSSGVGRGGQVHGGDVDGDQGDGDDGRYEDGDGNYQMYERVTQKMMVWEVWEAIV